jgi:hypothetical protein
VRVLQRFSASADSGLGRLIAAVTAMPEGWDDVLAELTHFMRWGPNDADGMTFSETLRWLDQAKRMKQQIGAKA